MIGDELCTVCGSFIFNKDVGEYTICYDPEWKRNIWGGDTHKEIGLICRDCGEKLRETGNLTGFKG